MDMIHSTTDKYGIVAKSLHWIMAILILCTWIVGYYAVDLPNKDPQKFKLFDLHKSVGMVILMLAVIRISWRLYDGAPRFNNTMHIIFSTAARTVHYLLYAFMFIQPLSGWAMSSAAGYNPTFFGLFTFPALVPKDPNTVETFVAIHNTSAMILLTLFVLHVGAAFFHHFVLKDNTLRRMTID